MIKVIFLEVEIRAYVLFKAVTDPTHKLTYTIKCPPKNKFFFSKPPKIQLIAKSDVSSFQYTCLVVNDNSLCWTYNWRFTFWLSGIIYT